MLAAALLVCLVFGAVGAPVAKPAATGCMKKHAALFSAAEREENKGDLQKAIAIFSQIVEEDPTCLEALTSLSFGYLNSENAEMAASTTRRIVELRPDTNALGSAASVFMQLVRLLRAVPIDMSV
jgi:hypothetical protein